MSLLCPRATWPGEEVWPLGFMHTLSPLPQHHPKKPLPTLGRWACCFLGHIPLRHEGLRPTQGHQWRDLLRLRAVLSLPQAHGRPGPRGPSWGQGYTGSPLFPQALPLLPAGIWVRAPESWLAWPAAWTRTPGPPVVLQAHPVPRRWCTRQTWGMPRLPPGPPQECPDSTWPMSQGD